MNKKLKNKIRLIMNARIVDFFLRAKNGQRNVKGIVKKIIEIHQILQGMQFKYLIISNLIFNEKILC